MLTLLATMPDVMSTVALVRSPEKSTPLSSAAMVTARSDSVSVRVYFFPSRMRLGPPTVRLPRLSPSVLFTRMVPSKPAAPEARLYAPSVSPPSTVSV